MNAVVLDFCAIFHRFVTVPVFFLVLAMFV